MTGRGRPVVFDEPAQAAYLTAISRGARIGDAATACGVDRRTPNQLAARSREFARLLADAKTAGKQARRDALPHGTESTYTNWGCRCPRCTKAATHGRGGRSGRGSREVMPMPQSEPPTAATPAPIREMMAA